ncbi:MAG: efflux RND transporter periplasmic adaptor subunit, partial [bacterium]|nr:efflux RND transporter periplasmic adaptor subunit [bacterium]
MSKKKYALLALVLLAAGGGTAAYVLKQREPEGIPVQSARVERLEIVQTVTATGKIQPETRVKISADVSAKITELAVKESGWVEKGDFLLELDRESYVAAVERTEANLRSSQANVTLCAENRTKAEKDHQRIRELFEKNLEPQSSLDAVYATFQVAVATHQSALDQVEQVRAILKQAQDDLAKTRIYAPMTGTVSELNKEVGEIALGSQFQEDVILVISNLEGMEALVDVDENDIVSIELGQKAKIEIDALPEEVFEGEVTEIANSAKT